MEKLPDNMPDLEKKQFKRLQLEKRRIKREIMEYKAIINKLQAQGMDVTDKLNQLKKRLGMEI
ncbi:hypothetical protein KAR91_18990 [Candidatus Pacearchaeota archaeon]|nr:hypothetical protein [Candidatus Pacearchaeota archaeon]